MQTHLSMAQDDIRDLKRKQNTHSNRSRKRPKLNTDARTLTSLRGRNTAAEKEVAKEAERQKKQAARDQRDTEEAERQRLRLTRDPNYAFFGSLGSKSKPDLVDIAHALGLRQVTHPGKEKLTKKKIQDFIEAHFDSNPEKRKDLRFEGLFDARRRPRTDENNASGANATASAPPSIHFSTHPQAPGMLPLSSNISNIIRPAPLPVLGPSQPHPHSQFPHPPYFGPGPFAVNTNVPYSTIQHYLPPTHHRQVPQPVIAMNVGTS